MVKDNIQNLFRALTEVPDTASAVTKRKRGHDFELMLRSLLESEGLNPRIRFRPLGEEIDGSFLLNGRAYLLEAKWHRDPIAASSIYQFKSKVDGKLVGTIGVFISISGYSKDAVDALVLGKSLNVVLFDRSDIEYSLAESTGFRTVLETKLRYAAEEGVVYFPYASILIKTASGKLGSKPQETPTEPVSGDKTKASPDSIIICEGRTDDLVLRHLVSRILTSNNLSKQIKIVQAMGKHGLARVANVLGHQSPQSTSIIIVADGDGNVDRTVSEIRKELKEDIQAIIITPEPEIEKWLLPREEDPKKALRSMAQERCMPIQLLEEELAHEADMTRLEGEDGAFALLVKALTS